MKAYVLKRWIRASLLGAGKQGRRTMISAEEILRFRTEYCLGRKRFGRWDQPIDSPRWETKGRIQPVYGRRVTPQAGFSLYRRADLRRLVKATS